MKTYYVITATRRLDKALGYGNLYLVNDNRPLNPDKRDGYSVVYLPDEFEDWYEKAIQFWDENAQFLSDLQA